MKARHITIIGITVLLLAALMTGVVQALEVGSETPLTVGALENVRDYAPAVSPSSPSYAIDAGRLFAGGPGAWTEIPTPQDVIVNAVALDNQRPDVVYIGAANELAAYRSTDAGRTWLRVSLSDTPGGVTDIAVDSAQRLVYAGTDTAGLFRLRDVGSSVIVGGQLLLDEPVRQVATDSAGTALAFARTDTTLYRAENFGLAWSVVDNLHSTPTSLAIADTAPATVYVGTVDRGVLTSADGQTWSLANDGLGMGPGTQLHIDALAVDPLEPEQIYVAASYLHGGTVVRQTSSRIAFSANGAASWELTGDEMPAAVTDLLPVSGRPGAVYALTSQSRSPIALGDTPSVAANTANPAAAPVTTPAGGANQIPLAWIIAALAALALGLVVTYSLRDRDARPLPQAMSMGPLETQTVNVVG